MQKNDMLALEITAMTLQGDGIGRAQGVPVFVPGVCLGDTVTARILKVQPRMAWGRCAEVLSPGAGRVEPRCEAFPRCGGCAFRCVDYALECEIKQREVRETLRRLGGAQLDPEPILRAQNPERYRNKALLPVQLQEGRVRAGFYARHSHRLVYSGDCALQPELFAQLAAAVCAWAEEVGCTVYDESARTGLLRHIYLRQTQNGAQVCVCLVINGSGVPRADVLIRRLRGVCPAVRGVVLNHNTADTNVALGRGETLLWGSAQLTETLCGVQFTLSPQSFFQVNPAQAQRLYGLAGEMAQLTGTQRVLDLYCGTGTIGLTMARRCGALVGAERSPQAVEDARRNAAQNNIRNARFLCADAAQAAAQLVGWQPDVVVLDPPRKGCEPGLPELIAQISPRRVVYISCDPATLARDIAAFAPLGYRPARLAPVDMFPRTGHVECCLLLLKEPAAGL